MIYNKWKQGLESTAPNLAGPVELETGSTVEYTITDYSNLYTYEIEVPFGSATITDNTISWSIPIDTTQGDYVFTLKRNGLVYSYIIRVVIVLETPSIMYPTAGLTINDFTFTATSSPFSSSSGSLHVSSDWQVATDSAFSNIVFQSLNDTTNKTSIQITVPSENTYYIRVRYKDSYNKYSQWSSAVSFYINVIPNSEFQILIASDKAANDYFGWSVSISENVAIVGASAANPGGTTDAGKAYIFRYNGTSWVQEAILASSDKAVDDNFGNSVSISGNVAIVGAPYADPGGTEDAGKAYIFRYNGTSWIQEAILIASDKAASDQFGYSVSISGDVAIVGANLADTGGTTDAGKAYIFRYNGTSWVQEAILTASDKAAGDYFGNSVSISGNVAIVGATYADPGGITSAGKAYIFRYNGTSWIQEAILIASDKAASDWFGYSVSISGNVAIVGAYYASPGGTSFAGKAYIFRYNGTSWIQEAILIASDKAGSDYFGWSVSISGSVAIIGASYGDPGGTTNAGKAYIFM
jgi:lipopolysaccharide export system protein LptA